jgi:hypothetical protein
MCDNCELYNLEKKRCNWVLTHIDKKYGGLTQEGCCMLRAACLKTPDNKLNCVVCHENLEYAKSVLKLNSFTPQIAAYYKGQTKRKNPHGISQPIWNIAIKEIGITIKA